MSPVEHAGRLERFVRQLEAGEYFAAHETLEAIWFPRRFEANREMKLLKGFINAAVSFELIRRGRPEPSKRAWRTYLKYRELLGTLQSAHTPVYRRVARYIEALRSELCNSSWKR